MRTSTAFFAGAGTIIAAIGLGLAGGLTVASMTNPRADRHETSLLDRRKSDDATHAATSQQPPIPYLAATVSARNVPAVTAPAALAKSATAAPPPTDVSPAARSKEGVEEARPIEMTAPKSTPSPEPAAKSAHVSPADDANARARDADLKRLSDKQKADRRQRWADRQLSEERKQRGEGIPRGDEWSDRRSYRDRRDGAQGAWNDASRREREYFDPDRRVRDERGPVYDRRDDADRRDDLGPPIRMFEVPRFGIFGAN
jgi:type IV secretory pathway VirB10-like protein